MGLQDIKLRLTENKKWDLDMDNVGRLKIVSGSDKLALQVAKAVMNHGVFSSMLNVPIDNVSVREVNVRLNILKRTQILMTNEFPNSIQGYKIYKSTDGLNFSSITNFIIQRKFVDEAVENEQSYFYAFTTIENDIESELGEVIEVKPTRDTSRKNFYLVSNALVQEDDGRIIFLFKFKRTFSASELLDSIIETSLIKDIKEPRAIGLRVKVANIARSYSDLTLKLGG